MLLIFFISSFIIIICSFNTLFTKINLLWLISKSIKALNIKTSKVFNLLRILLSCFFSRFLIIDLYYLIIIVIAQIFNSTAELAIPIGMPTSEAKAQIEAHPVTAETKIKFVNVI